MEETKGQILSLCGRSERNSLIQVEKDKARSSSLLSEMFGVIVNVEARLLPHFLNQWFSKLSEEETFSGPALAH